MAAAGVQALVDMASTIGSSFARTKRRAGSKSTSRVMKTKKSRIASLGKGVESKGHELKFVDVTNGGAPPITLPFTASGNAQLINGLLLGSGPNQRLGRRIQIKSIHVIGGLFKYQAGVAPTDDYQRLILLYDKQPNAAIFNSADLLQSQDRAGNLSTTAWDHLNMSNSERFVILRDCRFKIDISDANNVSTVSTEYTSKTNINWFVKMKNLTTHYNNATAGTVADITTGSVYLVAYGLKSSADTQYQFSGCVRMRYSDL